VANTNPKLRAELLKKLDCSPQALSQRRLRLQKRVAMPTDIATYVVAHREGLRIDKYLPPETIAAVNEADRRLDEKEGAGPIIGQVGSPGPRRTTKAKAVRTKEIRFDTLKVPRGSLSEKHSDEAHRMAGRAYPILYVFENSAREFIDGHLTSVYGKDWFTDDRLVSRPVRETVERNRKAEGRNRYHSQRNARPIYYTNLDDLVKIVKSQKGVKVFKDLFPRDTWFPELVGRFEVSRNVVAHMNPLKKSDIRRLGDDLADWMNQTAGREPGSS